MPVPSHLVLLTCWRFRSPRRDRGGCGSRLPLFDQRAHPRVRMILSGSSLIRPIGSYEEIFLTWFGVAGFACGKSGQVSGLPCLDGSWGRRRRWEVGSLAGDSGLGMRSFSALIQIWRVSFLKIAKWHTRMSRGGSPAGSLDALIAVAGKPASLRFLEFFTVNIRNPNTRAAYARAAGATGHHPPAGATCDGNVEAGCRSGSAGPVPPQSLEKCPPRTKDR